MEIAAKVFAYLFLVGPAVALFLTASLAWRGYVLAILWGWFVVPQFGLPPLSIPSAIGISMVVGMLTSNRTGKELEDKEKKWEPFARLVFVPAFALLIGWIVKQYL